MLTKGSETYKPFHYPWAVDFAVKHEQLHWHEGEAKLQADVDMWKTGKLTTPEYENITQILRLFTQSDVAVGTNYLEHYIPKFKNNEIRAMLTSFASREFVHQRAYALLNDTLGLAESEYAAFLDVLPMAKKIEWMGEVDASTIHGGGRAIVKSVINEGVSLFSAFAMLLNYQRFGKMKGMCEIVEWSVRDEDLHCEGMIKLFRTYCEEHPTIVTDDYKAGIYDMFREAIKLEDAIIEMTMPEESLNEVSAHDYKQYIRYLADKRLIQLGLKGNWHVKDNPLPWLDWLVAGDSFKNFFEGTVTDYNAGGLKGDFGW
jgi:ribonucleoside-diphosphate reductase beta chain